MSTVICMGCSHEIQRQEQIIKEEMSIYQRFMNGDIYAEVDTYYTACNQQDKYYEIIKEIGTFSIDQLCELVNNEMKERGRNRFKKLSYGYIDCLNSGNKALILNFQGIEIEEDDDSHAYFVLKEKDDGIYLTFSTQSWSRKGFEINRYGLLYEFGSSGAGEQCEEVAILRKDGSKQIIYSCTQLSGAWIELDETPLVDNSFNADEMYLCVSIFKIGNKRYYTYKIADNANKDMQKKATQYINECQNNGIKWVTLDKVENMILERKKELGVSDYHENAGQIEWTEDTYEY